jgi:hypothetical protein
MNKVLGYLYRMVTSYPYIILAHLPADVCSFFGEIKTNIYDNTQTYPHIKPTNLNSETG